MKNLAVITLAFGTFSMAMADTAHERRALTILVGDYVGVRSSALMKAAEIAQEVLRGGGVSTEWATCLMPEAGVSPGTCPPSKGPPDLVVWILPKAARSHPVSGKAMGMAVPGKPGELGRHAYVYHDRIIDAAAIRNFDAVRIMGYVIAHEIGHLLGNRHSVSGIMRTDWTKDDVADMSRGLIRFSLDEAQRMQENIAARLGREIQLARVY
jgi:hypothetical protein